MRISITFPIADSRIFLDPDKTGILKKPSWLLGLNPDEYKRQFVNFFGAIKSRKYKLKNVALNKAFELPDCEANRVIRFLGSNHNNTPIFISENLKFDLRTSRHFSFDSSLVGQLDISVTNVVLKDEDQLILTKEQLVEFVNHFLNLKVSVLNPDYNKNEEKSKDNEVFIECKLCNLDKYLANAYCKASTYKSKLKSIEPWWVKVGTPVLFLEIKNEEKISIPENWQHVIWKFGIFNKFKFLTGDVNVNVNGSLQKIPMYLFKSVQKKDYTVSRVMRTFILNLNAQQQCFNLILKNVAYNHIKLSIFVKELKETYKLNRIDGLNNRACKNSLNNINDFYEITLDELKIIHGDPIGKIIKVIKSKGFIEFFRKIIVDIVTKLPLTVVG